MKTLAPTQGCTYPGLHLPRRCGNQDHGCASDDVVPKEADAGCQEEDDDQRLRKQGRPLMKTLAPTPGLLMKTLAPTPGPVGPVRRYRCPHQASDWTRLCTRGTPSQLRQGLQHRLAS